MNDSYKEILVKRQTPVGMRVLKGALIGLTVLSLVAGLLMWPLLIVGAILIAVDYFVVPKFDVEYEYLFVNGEFDIDMVMAKSKRKSVKSFNLSEADLVAPLNSHRMDYYNGNQNMKVLDYSSGNPQHKRFGVITRLDNATCKIILEPDEALAQAMKKTAPSKVFLD